MPPRSSAVGDHAAENCAMNSKLEMQNPNRILCLPKDADPQERRRGPGWCGLEPSHAGQTTPPCATGMRIDGGNQGSGALRRRLPLRSSRSVSISRHWTQVRKARSLRTFSQLSSSVRVRLMPSLTSQSLASSTASSARVVSSSTVSSPYAARGGSEARREPYDDEEREWYGEVGLADEKLDVELVRVGDAAGVCTAVEANEVCRGRSSSRCCRRDSCCSWSSMYFCSAMSRLWFAFAYAAGDVPRASGRIPTGLGAAMMLFIFAGNRTRMVYRWSAFGEANGRIIGEKLRRARLVQCRQIVCSPCEARDPSFYFVLAPPPEAVPGEKSGLPEARVGKYGAAGSTEPPDGTELSSRVMVGQVGHFVATGRRRAVWCHARRGEQRSGLLDLRDDRQSSSLQVLVVAQAARVAIVVAAAV